MGKIAAKARGAVFVLATTLGLACIGGFARAESDSVPKPPRLILQITVDQLRDDMPRRCYGRLGEGGFRYLMEQGTVYLDAHHRHANVPIMFAGADIPAQRISRPGEMVDIARTRSLVVGAKPPPGSVGVVLREVLMRTR